MLNRDRNIINGCMYSIYIYSVLKVKGLYNVIVFIMYIMLIIMCIYIIVY